MNTNQLYGQPGFHSAVSPQDINHQSRQHHQQSQSVSNMPKLNSIIHQAPPKPPVEADYSISNRLANIDVVEQKITELIKYTKICLQELSRDKQITKNKMEEASQNFRKCLNSIDVDLSQQLDYLSKVCVGVDHQGSTFSSEANIRIAKQSEMLMENELKKVYENFFVNYKDDDPL
ncbi:Mediator complex, subunit Med11 family-containing protein [Strongyloides ratti]|uniref:Mediator of RNA polymerase II transcription subunit 11 n=1 Tax=Strongyloides ratti TaxID=34506 RepID=A0A090LCY5_STRRB|nr:Mediator complex, subunit Med11 family-containing protein [Strongyloides ratti]CEF67617.1 Mediator complex, subunit Med11 family-containing protein [Strongyloides ratti]